MMFVYNRSKARNSVREYSIAYECSCVNRKDEKMFVLRKKCPSTVKILTKAGKPKEYRRERLPHLRKKRRLNTVNPECKNLEWIARQMYCPNCGTVITSYQQGNMTKFECPRCRTVSVRTYKSRRQDVILLTIPKDLVRI